MSVADVTTRIQTIQSQLALLGARTGSTGSAAAFTSVLDGAVDTARLSSASGSSSGITGEQVVADAKKYLGVPYVWGGTDPQKGLDCSGLVQRVYRDLGVELPRVSRDQAQEGTPVASLDEAQPGDLLAFGSPVHHIAIYAGDGKMVEAPRPGLDVRITDVWETPSAIRRVIGTDAAASAPASSLLDGAQPLDSLPGVSSASTRSSAGAVPYADLFEQAASTYGVDADLLAAVARQESGFNASAVSPAGAQGLMQLMPATAQGLGVTDAFDPAQAVAGAAKLLSQLQSRFGSTPLALAAYNAGPGAVLRYDGVPPYPETQNYVTSIMSMLGQS